MARIAVFTQNLAGGGAERMMLNLAVGLANAGDEVDLVLVRNEGPYRRLVPAEVRLIGLGVRKVAFCAPALARYLRRERPVAMVSTLVHVNVAAVVARWLSRCPTRVILREDNYVSCSRQHAPTWSIRMAYRLLPWVYPWADGFVGVSQSVSEDLARWLPSQAHRIHTIHNPVVSDKLFEDATQSVDHPWLNEGQFPVLLAVGRLAAQKDYPTLLRAFATARRGMPLRLLILGEGPERQAIELLIEELDIGADVALLGFQENPCAWMARASVLVSTSRWEGFPNVIVEAMACGTPVIATDCPGGSAEILRGGQLGRLVPVGDYEALARAIENMIGREESETVRQRALEFTVEHAVEQYRRVLLGEVSSN